MTLLKTKCSQIFLSSFFFFLREHKGKKTINQITSFFVPTQNVNMSTTMRRLGEEIYYPKSARVTEVEKIIGTPTVLNEKLKDALFLRSANSHIRLLSALIVLKTLSRCKWRLSRVISLWLNFNSAWYC